MINNPTDFPTGEQQLFLQGPAGNLETITNTPNQNQKPITAIICHPHPLHEGTMHNKVVSTLHRTLRDQGARTIRFNFRGVGQSEGSYGDTDGESEDLLAVYEWIKQVQPQDEIWLAGFSFGSYIATRVASEHKVTKLITIAPPVNHFDFDSLKQIQCPWIIVQGSLDEIVPAQEVKDWYKKLPQSPIFIEMPDATHFFHGKLVELRNQLAANING